MYLMLNYNSLTVSELSKLLSIQDTGVIKFIYDKYSPAIYGVILQRVNSTNEADAILYTTFVTFIKGKYKASSTQSVFMYLYNIATTFIKNRSILYPIKATDMFSGNVLNSA